MDVIKAHPLPALLNNALSDTVNETLLLYSQGNDIETIAHKRELGVSTVYSHLAAAIGAGLINVRDVLSLDDAQYTEICQALELHETGVEGKLKPVHEALDESYVYGVLRCVQADLYKDGAEERT